MTVVSIKGVVKNYQLGQTLVKALRGVDLEVRAGEFLCICGPSGSGKSTLLNLIGCLDVPTAGEIRLIGKDVLALSPGRLAELRSRTIGFIFQTFNLIPVLTAFENVEYPLVLRRSGRAERRTQAERALEAVELKGFAHHRPAELSGGQMQWVAIARALVAEPPLVLADEPTANLDSETAEAIIQLMLRLNREKGTTFIFSTHDPRVVRHAERVVELRDGKIAGEVLC